MDQYNTFDKKFKLFTIGDNKVGKSSIIKRYAEGIFNEETEKQIPGVDFKMKTINFQNKKIKLEIWYLVGRETNIIYSSLYYKATSGFILVYDITDKQSFNNIDNWYMETTRTITPIEMSQFYLPPVFILVGNKSDLEDKREVLFKEGSDYADSKGMKFIETSAKIGDNIEDIFTKLCSELLVKADKIVDKSEDINKSSRGFCTSCYSM